ncbi:hypothetical protein OG563_38070 [Nocardia vinacea]|uniref:MFS transporter n=1 Tax=Nocardia vinacea TaxID=96468 RepID=A0ABZ1YRJ7_9NOCA|nr:hypothetical protein [Nocardia vinacea]
MNRLPVSPHLRAIRAAVFAAIGVLLSAVGHAAASGHSVSSSALVVAFAATGAVAWAVADRQRGIIAIGGGLLVMETVLHLWFGIFAVSNGHHSSHAAAVSGPAMHAGPLAMIAGHAVAAMVCAVWLWCGERVLFALLGALYSRILVPLLLVLVHPLVDDAAVGVRTVFDRVAVPRRGVVLRHVLARRGPPVGVVVV